VRLKLFHHQEMPNGVTGRLMVSRSSALGPRVPSMPSHTATTALVNLASNWAFGKKKVGPVAEPVSDGSASRATVHAKGKSRSTEVSASDLLRRF